MKLHSSIVFLAAGAALVLTLAGCSQATAADAGTKPPVVRPYTTASSDIGVGLTFEDGKALVVKDYAWAADAEVVTDQGTNGTWVLSMTSTGSYQGWEYTFPTPVDFTTAKTLVLDLKAPSTDGTVLAVLDASGNGYGFWVPGTGSWSTATLNIATTGITDNATPTPNTGWSWSSTAGDMTKITKLRITANEHKETILADNISLK